MKLTMNRYLTTALIVLGLVFQPFGMMLSANGMDDHPETMEMSMGVSEMGAQMSMTDGDSQPPCHEDAQAKPEGAMDDKCVECCVIGCAMMAQCGALGTPFTANNRHSFDLSLHKRIFDTAFPAAWIGGTASPIYHPPRHS